MSGAQRRRMGCVLASAFLLSAAALACTQTPPEMVRLSRTFDITVSEAHHKPMTGVRVSLGTLNAYKVMHAVARGTTDSSGGLRFQNIPIGNFTLQFTDATGDQQYREITVVKAGGTSSLQLEWPFVNWIPLRSASALLKMDAEPLRHYQVKLLGTPDGGVLGASDTDRFGRFDLLADRPGRYFIELFRPDSDNGNATDVGRIPVEITGDGALPALDTIYIAETPCGLQSDRVCTPKPQVIASTCVHLVDWSGADISNASARVASKSGSFVRDDFKTDAKGNLNLSDFAPGDYDLEIFANGFAPSRITVHKGAAGASCEAPSVITMNTIGYGCQPPEQGKVN